MNHYEKRVKKLEGRECNDELVIRHISFCPVKESEFLPVEFWQHEIKLGNEFITSGVGEDYDDFIARLNLPDRGSFAVLSHEVDSFGRAIDQ